MISIGISVRIYPQSIFAGQTAMEDLQSAKFILDNIAALETFRDTYRLSPELYRTVTSLIEDWKSVESITFKIEPNYANCPIKPLLKEPTNRAGQDLPSVYPGNPPIPPTHAYSMQSQADPGNWPKNKTDPLNTRSPQLPPRTHTVVYQESTYPSANRPLPPTPLLTEKRAPVPITAPSDSAEIKRYLSREQEKTDNTPCYINTPSNTGTQPNNTEKKQAVNPIEIHSRDWSYQNAEDARLPPNAIPPIEVIQPERPRYESDPSMQTRRPGMVELNIFGEGSTIIHGDNEPIEYNNYPWGAVVDKEVATHSKKSGTYPRERPQFPVPGDSNYLHTPGNNKDNADKLKIERSSSIDVLMSEELKPQLPPRRKSVETIPQRQRMRYESKPGDPEYTNWKETYSHNPRQMGKGVPFFDGIERDSVSQNYDEVEILNNENEPTKTSDDYLMVFSSFNEKPPQDNRLAVFNLRELISEKTELQTDQQGLKRRKVIIERTYTHEEIEFYDLISNYSMFYIYLSEHNLLIQEIISLEQPIGKLLTEKLSSFYSIDFSKTVITRGAQIGLLEVNDRMYASLQKVENFFKKLYTKGKNVLDPRLSLHQSNVTNSHLICVSQTDSVLDKNNFEAYLGNRDTKLMNKFQRLFIPLIQGTVPLRKDEIKDLISNLIVIYRIKDWEMLIPEIYKGDRELKSDIESSIGLLYKCSPEEVIPQVTRLVKDCKMRESIYFYVKINNKLDKKLSDAVLGVSSRNIHLISVSRNCEIDLAYMWGLGDLEAWRPIEKGIILKFIDGTTVMLSSPEQCEELIHVVLKSAIDPKKYLFAQ